MRYRILTVMAMAVCMGCDKKDVNPEPPGEPPMHYTGLQDQAVKPGKALATDLDGDGRRDFVFTNWYIGDPVEEEDEILYFAASYIHSRLLCDGANQSPIFNTGDMIPARSTPGYNWYEVAQVEMAKKNIRHGGAPYWEGAWKSVQHKFLAVQVTKNNKHYSGWIEVSFNTGSDELILHRAALCKEPGRPVRAGQ